VVCCPDSNKNEPDWTLIGSVADKFTSDFAKETLASCEIPVVIMSHAGFFGTAGLTFTQFYDGKVASFEVSVPKEDADSASEILQLALGDKWRSKGN
jgi:hypothetical protein